MLLFQVSQAAAQRPETKETRLNLPEGLYLIRSASEGRIIESQHTNPCASGVHVFVAPATTKLSHYQLWVVLKKNGKNLQYNLRNFATGAALDVHKNPNESNHVVCWSTHRRSNQTWEFHRSRQSKRYGHFRHYGQAI